MKKYKHKDTFMPIIVPLTWEWVDVDNSISASEVFNDDVDAEQLEPQLLSEPVHELVNLLGFGHDDRLLQLITLSSQKSAILRVETPSIVYFNINSILKICQHIYNGLL